MTKDTLFRNAPDPTLYIAKNAGRTQVRSARLKWAKSAVTRSAQSKLLRNLSEGCATFLIWVGWFKRAFLLRFCASEPANIWESGCSRRPSASAQPGLTNLSLPLKPPSA